MKWPKHYWLGQDPKGEPHILHQDVLPDTSEEGLLTSLLVVGLVTAHTDLNPHFYIMLGLFQEDECTTSLLSTVL